MTSMRPDGDDAWTYLRPSAEAQKFLSFEDRGEGLYELICGEGWPSRVATNRPDGSYATRDLFVRHPTLNAWKYSGRIDDVIVLEKGEKANPLPIEGAVRQDELVEEAVVFGPGKPHFGIMIVLSPLATGLSEVEIIDRLSPLIESSQTLLPAYAKISRDMVLLLPPGTPYPRTDKGTVIRKAFYAHFSKEIDEAYTDKVSSTTRTLSESELREFIRSETQAVLYLKDTSSLPDDQDFFELGMDSLQASQLRAVLVQNVNTNGERLDLNIVFDYPSVGSLAHKVHSISLGSSPTTASSSVEDEMKSLIEKYGNFDQHVPRPRTSEGQYVVRITGEDFRRSSQR
jgi:aryl carrier-like protein